MDAGLALSLLVLALVDSTSFGTLLIPLWLLAGSGRVRPAPVLLFLATVAGFYLVMGLALAAGATVVLDDVRGALASDPGRVVQGVGGASLMVLGLTVEPLTRAGKEKRAATRAAREAVRSPGRLLRWRRQAMEGGGSARAVAGLALTAAALEAASMVPYLTAIGLLAASPLDPAPRALALAGYCLVMVLPALLLLAARLALHERLVPFLARVEAWLTRSARETLAWVLFLVGLLVLRGAVVG